MQDRIISLREGIWDHQNEHILGISDGPNTHIHGNLKVTWVIYVQLVTTLPFCKNHSDGLRIGSQTASYLKRKRKHIKRGFCHIRFKKSNMFSKKRCYRKL